MTKRSLTLLETLVALVLLLAIGALVFPSLVATLDERTFESAADETNDQLMLARAHAQATGTPVEVTFSADTSRVQARLFVGFLPGMTTSPNAARTPSGGNSYPNPAAADAADQSIIPEAWAIRYIGRGVRFTARPPAALTNKTQNRDSDELLPGEYETLEDLGKGQSVRLAVFMPDGSALLGDKVWINDDKGRLGVFTINPWSGVPFFERLADLGEPASSAMNPADASPVRSDSPKRWSAADQRSTPANAPVDVDD